MPPSNYYSKERIENISCILPTYAAFLREGDRVNMGIEADPMYPYRGVSRPTGTVKSVVGPSGAQMVNIQLDAKFGNRIAHSDVRSLNPYLSFEPDQPTYQRALSRAQNEPSTQSTLRAEITDNEVIFRGMFGGNDRNEEIEYRNARKENDDVVLKRIHALEERFRGLEREHDETRSTTMKAVRGIANDIREQNGDATYAGRMLDIMDSTASNDVEFRGFSDESDVDEEENFFGY